MKDSQKPDHVSLTNIVSSLREGRYVIPDFQRDFEWEHGTSMSLCAQSSVTTISVASYCGRARRRTLMHSPVSPSMPFKVEMDARISF